MSFETHSVTERKGIIQQMVLLLICEKETKCTLSDESFIIFHCVVFHIIADEVTTCATLRQYVASRSYVVSSY